VASRPKLEIASLRLWLGRDRIAVGELFAVKTTVTEGAAAELRLEGDLAQANGIGAGMTGGKLTIDGSVGHDAGVGMSGGTLVIRGDAGDRLGGVSPGAARGMSGGEILVHGSVGREAAARMRRGLIIVGGHAGEDAGRAMIAGSLVVLGDIAGQPGRGSKRGSIVACGAVTIPATYRYACTYNPPHLRVTFLHVKRQHGFAIGDALLDSAFRRHCGDAGEPGKGEILERVRA